MLRSKSRSGYLEFGQKKHSSSFLIRTISGSKICRGDNASQVNKQALVSLDRNSVSLSENRIVKAAMMQKELSSLEEELRNTKARLNESETERKNVNDLLVTSKKDIESKDKQIKLLITQLEAAKVYKVKLGEREASIEKLNKSILELEDELKKAKESESNMLDSLMIQTRQIEQTKMDLEEAKLEIRHLNQELKLQGSSEQELLILRKEVRRLNQLRIETEDSISAWSAKEMGFITCINTAYEENASLTRQNNKLHEALMAAENTTRITREEASKLRDIVKQAVNESNVAKETSNVARSETSKLKDLLSKKEESLRALIQENERLVAKEAAANENMNEFKRLLTAKTEAANKAYEDHHTEVFNSPDSSPQHMFNFDFDGFNKEEDDHHDTFEDVDPEKFEALKGSIFDTDESPKSEARTPPKAKAHHHHNHHSGVEDADHHRSHAEHGDDKGYYLYGLYHRKKLFRKIGDLIVGKNNGKKEGSTIEHGKEEQGKEEVKEQGKEEVKEQGKEQTKEQGKQHEHEKEQTKEHEKEQTKEHEKEKM